MQKYGIAGISGVDTRKLNRSIRDYGTRKCLITDINTPLEEGLRKLHSYQMPANAVSRVSSKVIWHSPSQSPASLHDRLRHEEEHPPLPEPARLRCNGRPLEHDL